MTFKLRPENEKVSEVISKSDDHTVARDLCFRKIVLTAAWKTG